MSSEIKIYNINDFIRKNEIGEIDFDKSIQIVKEVSFAAAFHPDHNILIDVRETTLSDYSMDVLIKVAMEVVKLMPSFKNKIANVVPNDANRVSIAERFEACMNINKFQYKFFTSFEDAIEWLSDVKC
jgi:hypothetical protein